MIDTPAIIFFKDHKDAPKKRRRVYHSVRCGSSATIRNECLISAFVEATALQYLVMESSMAL